jgi:two-component system, sensor histidine kinase
MARAEAANRAKSDFLSTMSHEIRTPLHGVLGMGSVLADSQLDGAQKESLETMLSSGRHLLGLINDLLDFSKIEAGKLELDPRPFRLAELGEDLYRMLGPLAREKGLEFRTKFEIAPELWVFGDQPRLRQILTNLLGNAMKFTPSGYIALRIVALMDADNGVLLRAEVQDSGVGIPYSKQSVIFDSFGQADASTAREFGGTGLGLSISRSLARLMGGDMGVLSELGQGATFWLTAPLSIATAPLVVTEVQHKLPQAPNGVWNILLVDDNAVNLKVGSRMLEKLGCRVVCAADGELAVQAWQQQSPDLILMDMRMPVLDGIGATCKIRETELGQGLRRTPIVALTANSFVEDREACFAAGMDDFLAKPFTPQALREILARLLVQS